MTEWQKIVDKGIVTEDFLKEETICECTVSPELKKIWAINLDLLEEFKRVCEKYNLRYFAIGGTLLGAVRHQGFIPWDDDIDLCMPRKDYDLLTKDYAHEFAHPYFMQTPYTDEEYAYSFAKIRNVNTCFASATFIESPMNQGAFIDIFPIDETVFEGCFERSDKILEVLRYCSAFMSRNNKYTKNKHTELAKNTAFSKGDNIKLYEKLIEIARSHTTEDFTHYSCEVCRIYPVNKTIWPKECFSEYIDLPFCNTTIRAPKDYDAVLKVLYNDYNRMPPVEARVTVHTGVITDLDRKFDAVREDVLKAMEREHQNQQ